jgi:hypothetical protein
MQFLFLSNHPPFPLLSASAILLDLVVTSRPCVPLLVHADSWRCIIFCASTACLGGPLCQPLFRALLCLEWRLNLLPYQLCSHTNAHTHTHTHTHTHVSCAAGSYGGPEKEGEGKEERGSQIITWMGVLYTMWLWYA